MNLPETKAISIGSYDKELWVRHVPDYFLSNKPLSPFNADFNQISSVWAKFSYWQDMFNFCLLM